LSQVYHDYPWKWQQNHAVFGFLVFQCLCVAVFKDSYRHVCIIRGLLLNVVYLLANRDDLVAEEFGSALSAELGSLLQAPVALA
jgi:hypothetical protein